jgi:MYXO-CTERM domain-containing protein
LPTTSTLVGVQSCDSTTNTETDQGPCDGAGGGGATKKSCGFFTCTALPGTTCRTNCTVDTDCASGAYCDAAGSCQPKGGKGTACASNDQCTSGLGCVDGVCCDDPSCSANHGFCGGANAGHCMPANGQACTGDAQCSSGHCADGVCCDTACNGLCETCNSSDSAGKCIPVTGVPATGHGSCPAGTGDVCSAARCDGTSRTTCAGLPGGEVTCAPATCKDGTSTSAQTCNGSGTCPTATTSPCPNFRTCKDGSTCNAGACAADADCANSYVCDTTTGLCGPKTAHCKADDSTVSVGIDGAEQSCSPYLCDVSGACKSACVTSGDCVGGFVCSVSQCVSPGNGTTSSAGCEFGRSEGDSRVAWLAVAVVAAIGRTRRRRG